MNGLARRKRIVAAFARVADGAPRLADHQKRQGDRRNGREQGDVAGAAAMAMLIVYVSIAVRVAHTLITKGVLNRTQGWRQKLDSNN